MAALPLDAPTPAALAAWAFIADSALVANAARLAEVLEKAGVASAADFGYAIAEPGARDFVNDVAGCLKLAGAGRFRAALGGGGGGGGGGFGGNVPSGVGSPAQSGGEDMRALIVVLAEMQRAQAAAAEASLEALRSQTAALHALSAGLQGATSPATPAQRAACALAVLERLPGGVTEATAGAGDAVLSAAAQADVDAVARDGNETDVARVMTPVLARLRGCAPGDVAGDACMPMLVNSEYLQWLEHPAGRGRRELRLKPDLFRSWRPFVTPRAASNAQQGTGVGYEFGTVASAALQRAGCAAEMYEAKHNALSAADFGELCAYHECGRGSCRGVLFGPRAFWLYESFDGHPVRLVRGAWAAQGSVDVFRTFFATAVEPPLVTLLRRALIATRSVVRDGAPGPHLGSGANGHVFAVHTGAGAGVGPLRALKVVLTDAPARVAAEFGRCVEAAARGAPVVPPVAGSRGVFDDGATTTRGGVYLLADVGEPFKSAAAAAPATAFSALAALHAAGVAHGDARVPNLVLVSGALRWIDLLGGAAEREGAAVHPGLARADAELLAASLLTCAAQALPAAVAAAVARYDSADATAVAELAKAVAEARTATK